MSVDLFSEFIIVVLVTVTVPLISAGIASFLVATIQSATQIQEQVFPFLIRLSVALAVFFCGSSWISLRMQEFWSDCVQTIAQLGAMCETATMPPRGVP